MGRWAEVYFTSPPEKREQAVLDLLRELEAKDSPPEDKAGSTHAWGTDSPSGQALALDSQAGERQPILVRCRTCGRSLPASQKYCGMCGVRQALEEPVEALPIPGPLGDRVLDPPHSRYAPWRGIEPRYDAREHEVYEMPPATNELSLFQTGGRDSYDDDEIFSYPAPSHSYRVYVGIVLAAVMIVLGYMAWRSAQATSQTAHVEPQAPPAVATRPAAPAPAPESSSPSASNTDAPVRTSAAEKPTSAPSSHTTHAPGNKASAKSAGRTSSNTTPATAPDAQKDSPAEGLTGNGSEELSIAQRYLNGGNGLQTNKSEAAKWLWKAMAKHNARATLLLADLYLKGDGVSKNCDQARVLLDSAARGGMKEAGDRLRHLPAFGCQ